jgi:hypothetical protein
MKFLWHLALTCLLFVVAPASASAQTLQEVMAKAEAGQQLNAADQVGLQRMISRYAEIIQRFQGDPEIWRVQLKLVECLCMRQSVEYSAHRERAADILEKLVSETDLNSEQGREIAFTYANFHLTTARNLPARNLQKALNTAGELRNASRGNALVEVRALVLRAKLETELGKLPEAIRGNFEAWDLGSSAFAANTLEVDERDQLSIELHNIFARLAGFATRHPSLSTFSELREGLNRRPAFPITGASQILHSIDAARSKPRPPDFDKTLLQESPHVVRRLILLATLLVVIILLILVIDKRIKRQSLPR